MATSTSGVVGRLQTKTSEPAAQSQNSETGDTSEPSEILPLMIVIARKHLKDNLRLASN